MGNDEGREPTPRPESARVETQERQEATSTAEGVDGDALLLADGGWEDGEESEELVLSKLLIGLHRRVMWKRMVFSTVTPMSQERRDLYSKQPG